MKGIVYDIGTGKVLYKFDTPTLSALRAEEEIKLREDINNILVGATINSDGTYTNPVFVPVVSQLETDIANMDFVSLSDAKTKIKGILERIRKGER